MKSEIVLFISPPLETVSKIKVDSGPRGYSPPLERWALKKSQ